MTEPRIQYAKTSDGVNIAYWTLGEGSPLVIMPIPLMSHIQMEWENPAVRTVYERMSESRQIIRYDCRAAGLSDRSITDFSLEALVMDLEAVVDGAHLERFILLAPHRSGMAGVSYAALHPERISNLLLWHTSTKDTWGSRALHATRELVEQDWEFFIDTYIQFLMGLWREGEKDRSTSLMKAATSPEAVLGFDAAFESVDVSDLLSKVRAPTLVLHPREDRFGGLAGARRLAAGIPHAQLSIVGGGLFGRAAALAISEFLGEGDPRSPAIESSSPGAIRTVLFTDLVGHTEMMQRLGDAKGREVLREHEQITRETLQRHGGTEVKTMGDGFLASFGSVTKAVKCAIALQRAFAGREGEPLSVRVGLNAGEPIEEDGDLFGATVIVASRIAAHAGADEILIPETVRGLCSGKGFLFSDRGEFVPKGFEDAVRVYEVKWHE